MGLLKKIKRPKVLFPLVAAIIIIAAIVLAVRTLNSPAEGTVTTRVSDTTAGQPKQTPPLKTYTDQSVTFNYPSKYSAEAGNKSSGYIDTVSLAKTVQRTQFASIGIYKGVMANDSGVNFRRAHTELYKSLPASPGSLVFAKTDSTEYTGFLQKGEAVVTISFTSVSPADFSSDYNAVASSLQLKR